MRIKCRHSHNVNLVFYNFVICCVDGPDDVTITRLQDLQNVESQFITLLCTIKSMYPSAAVTWRGVNCSSGSNSTGQTDDNVCSFLPTRENDGKVVTCVAKNSMFPDRLVQNATYRIHVKCKFSKLFSFLSVTLLSKADMRFV